MTAADVLSPPDLQPASPEVKRYQRQKLLALVLATLLGLFYLAVVAFWLGPWLGPELVEIIGEASGLQLLAMAAVLAVGSEIVTFPIAYWSGFILEHRYELSTQSLGAWLWKRVKGYVVGGILGSLLLLGLYGVIWEAGSLWWIWATAGWLLVSLVLGRLMPIVILPLFYKITRLEDTQLLERLRHLAQGTGLTVEGVYRLHLSRETRKANAALAGLGKSRRVLLGDTLLEQFTPEEIEVVFAHEVGHHVHRHLPKMIIVSVFLALVGFWLVDLALNALALRLGYTGLGDPAALPLVLFVLTVFGLVLSPAENALSRFFEVQCDRYALERTGNRDAYRGAFIKLARLNKSDPDPHPLAAWLFYDHPPIRQRLALADPK
jgi:STE24 endopeptidase